jgi:hypothetical protein
MPPVPRRLLAAAAPLLVLLLALLVALRLPATAGAFPLSGCTLTLTSTDASGAPHDSVADGGAAGSMDDPFLIEWDGSVRWEGTTGSQVITDTAWQVDVFYLPTPLRGGDPNAAGDQQGTDDLDVSATAPFRLAGLFFVSGSLSGDGGSCSGSGWFKIAGDPIGTAPFGAGIGAALLGLALLYVGWSRRSWSAGVLGGFLLGLGLAMVLITISVLPLGAATPLVLLGLCVLVGVATARFGRMRAPAVG